ncbi:MAG TPA: FG-GAP-like repeat-containing protein, partial [Baekduia sp.]
AAPAQVFAGNIDGDGHQDVLVVTRDAGDHWQAIAYLGHGDGTFGPGTVVDSGSNYRTAGAGDFDGDGDLDFVISEATGSDELLHMVPIEVDGGQVLMGTAKDAIVPARVDDLTVANFRGDAGEDIAVNDAAGAVRIYDFDAPNSPDVADDGGFSVRPGPLVGYDAGQDGDIDILGPIGDGPLFGELLYNHTGGSWTAGLGSQGVDLGHAIGGDFDGDGHQDAVIVDSNGRNVFIATTTFDTAQILPAVSAVLAAGDFNGDGDADVVALARTGLSTLLTVTPAALADFGAIPGVVAATAADFDEDGRADLVTAEGGDSFALRLSRTDDYPGPALTDPPALTNDPTPEVVSGPLTPGAASRCRVDGGAWSACGSSPHALGPLGDGAHTFEMQEKRAGLTFWSLTSSVTFTVDATAPDAPQFTQAPAAVSSEAGFAFTGEAGASFECDLDSAGFMPCTSPYEPSLADGAHTVEVRQLDLAGNASPSADSSFTLDTAAPSAPQFTQAPAAISSEAGFAFTGEAGASFECDLDSAGFMPCTSPYEPSLADGAHTVTVRQVDDAGNASATVDDAFTLDTTAPDAPTLLAGPPASGTEQTARFDFAGEPGAAFECALDDGNFEPCASAAEVAGLAYGEHRFAIRQTDLAGNTGPAHETRFTVTEPPKVDAPVTPPAGNPAPAAPVQPGPPAASPRPRPGKATVVARKIQVIPGGDLPVGCRLDQGKLKSCSVTAYVRSGGKRVRVGVGRAGDSGVVRVKLTPQGRRFVNRLGGVTVQLRLRATGADGTVLTDSLRVRLLPLRVISVPTDGLFAIGGAALLPQGRRYVRGIARQLDDAARVDCVGHTDSVGTDADNRRLGLARAQAVCRLLRAAGVGGALRASSRGEAQPRASNLTARGRSLNRRVELTVSYRKTGS